MLTDIIESSASGEHPYRATAMELIIERSIRERRQRTLARSKDTPRPNPTSQLQISGERQNIPAQQAQSAVPASAPLTPPQSLLDPIAPATVEHEAPRNSTLSKPVKKPREVQHDEPPANTKVSSQPLEAIVQLVCVSCGIKQRRSGLLSGVHCSICPERRDTMRCLGCGTIRTEDVRACAGCHGRFKK